MKDVMIDIETLATRNDAAIIQIGAVAFDPKTGEVGPSMLVSVDENFYEGETAFHVCEKTQAWWAGQKEAKKSLQINKVGTIYIAMDRLREFFEGLGDDFVIAKKRSNSSRVWANPPQFDLSILRYAASKAYGDDNALPWEYWQETDLRTLQHVLGYVKYEDLGEAAEGLIAHRADHDAIRQALIVSHLIKEQ